MRTTWLKMQNSLFLSEDAQSTTPFLSSYPNWKIRRNTLKIYIEVWISERPHKQTHCCRSPTWSWLTKIATRLRALTTVPCKIDFYGNDFSTRNLQLSKKHWNCRWQQNCLSPRAGSVGRAAVSQPAGFGNGTQVPTPRDGQKPLCSPAQRRMCEREIHSEHCSLHTAESKGCFGLATVRSCILMVKLSENTFFLLSFFPLYHS